jgi:glycosyltransferase involved in cell wall biosynthesis
MQFGKESPLVSIIVVSYNHDKYIRDCISSILKQDYENFELIVVDNGSTDSSIDIINISYL